MYGAFKLSFKVSCYFFHWKISLYLNLSSISAIMSVLMDFWSSIVAVPFSLQADEETAADENKVPIRALVCFVGTKESTDDRRWGYRDGNPVWFRWFRAGTSRSAVCLATGIAVCVWIALPSRDSGYFGTDVKAPKWKIHSLLSVCVCVCF